LKELRTQRAGAIEPFPSGRLLLPYPTDLLALPLDAALIGGFDRSQWDPEIA